MVEENGYKLRWRRQHSNTKRLEVAAAQQHRGDPAVASEATAPPQHGHGQITCVTMLLQESEKMRT